MNEESLTDKLPASFEDAFAQLEGIVRQLESGSLPLDASLALFEQGQRLAAYCSTKLDEAELKIQQLTADPGD
ncbi:MAG: exodeoxyribonuclease VII small subunit [Thermoflexales bacterium]|nr:exodeoxyribonuclease VII small subunit [Thermoflexales bacterium]